MWAQEGECGVNGCEGCQYGGAGEEVAPTVAPTVKQEPRVLFIRQPSALEEVGIALRGLPGEVADWWHNGHARSSWLRRWEDGNCADWDNGVLFYHNDYESIHSWEDYKLWRMLGRVSDALILLLVLTIVLIIALALI